MLNYVGIFIELLKQSKQVVKDGQDKSCFSRRDSGEAHDQLEDSIPKRELQRHMKTQETRKVKG